MESAARQQGQQQGQQHGVDGADVLHVVQQRPHWAASVAAAAAHPALHLAIRQTLHRWLAASGNPLVWRLLLLYLQAGRDGASWRAASSRGAAAQQAGGFTRQQGQPGVGQPQVQLPPRLAVLHPPALAPMAALLLTEAPTEAGLERAVAGLQAFLQQPLEEEDAEVAQQVGQGGTQTADLPGGAPSQQAGLLGRLLAEQQQLAARQRATRQRHEAVWRLQLDAPEWALFCLRCLPLQQLLQMAATQEGTPAAASPGVGAEGQRIGFRAACIASRPNMEGSLASAAAYISLLAWPGEQRCRQVLQEALCLQLQDVSLPAVRPWLDTLLRWQGMLASWCSLAD